MPLNANFLADFTSFLSATAAAIDATQQFQQQAAGVGPAVDQSLQQSSEAMTKAQAEANAAGEKIGADIGERVKKIAGAVKETAGAVSTFVAGYIKEYAEAEAATSRLAAAVKSAGFPPETIAAYKAMADQLSRISTFDDTDLTAAQTILTTIGGIKPADMQAVLMATMEVANGMKKDLLPAAEAMARAAETNGAKLGFMKTALHDSIEPGRGFAGVMAAVNKEFGGQTAASIETTAGSIKQLENSMSSINEQVGKVFAENLKVILGAFQAMPEWVQTAALSIAAIGTALAPVLVSLASFGTIAGQVGLTWAGVGEAIAGVATFILGIIGPAGWLVLAIAAFAVGMWGWKDEIVSIVTQLYNGIKTWLYDKLSYLFNRIAELPPIVTAAFSNMFRALIGASIVPDLINGIQSQFGRLDSVMVDPALAAARQVQDGFSAIGGASLTVPGVGSSSLNASASAGANGMNVSINMSGMLGTDDPQTRAKIKELVSDALMSGMRGSRLLGTA